MSKENMGEFFKPPFKNNVTPKYPAVFDDKGNRISNGEYNFSGLGNLYDNPEDNMMEADGNGEYNLKTIGGFIDVNKHRGDVEVSEIKETEDEALA